MASESAKEDEKVSENGGSIAFGESRAKKVWLALEKCVKNITIEPILCFWTVSTSMNGISCASLYFDKTCKSGSIWFGNGTSYPDEVCDHIDSGEYDDIQNSVQRWSLSENLSSRRIISIFQSL